MYRVRRNKYAATIQFKSGEKKKKVNKIIDVYIESERTNRRSNTVDRHSIQVRTKET